MTVRSGEERAASSENGGPFCEHPGKKTKLPGEEENAEVRGRAIATESVPEERASARRSPPWGSGTNLSERS